MKFYWVRTLFIVLVRCLVHTPVRTPTYGLPLSQSDQRIRSVFQSVYDNAEYCDFFLTSKGFQHLKQDYDVNQC